MSRFYRGIILTFTLSFLLAPMVIAATVPGAGPGSLQDITTIVTTIVDWIRGIVLLIGIAMIAWAGYTWMTAGGDEAKFSEARNRLIWGLVGIGVAVFATVAKDFVVSVITP